MITRTAMIFVAIWPVGMPACYLALLLACYRPMKEHRTTKLLRATKFLHKEYEALCANAPSSSLSSIKKSPHAQTAATRHSYFSSPIRSHTASSYPDPPYASRCDAAHRMAVTSGGSHCRCSSASLSRALHC